MVWNGWRQSCGQPSNCFIKFKKKLSKHYSMLNMAVQSWTKSWSSSWIGRSPSPIAIKTHGKTVSILIPNLVKELAKWKMDVKLSNFTLQFPLQFSKERGIIARFQGKIKNSLMSNYQEHPFFRAKLMNKNDKFLTKPLLPNKKWQIWKKKK